MDDFTLDAAIFCQGCVRHDVGDNVGTHARQRARDKKNRLFG
jgi:hypothetical protein